LSRKDEPGGGRPVIDRPLPLSQAALAHEIVAARSGIGKVVLDATRV
jgi:NADPH:quinone reductase-like Zn-dependent oxidoreductase